MSDYLLPEWIKAELVNHPGIEIKWLDWGPRKVFVLPLLGDAFWRIVTPSNKTLPTGTVMYRRHISAGTSLHWMLHERTYLPPSDCVTDGRWVVFQTHVASGELVKLFDVVNDDGSFHPLDRRVLDAIHFRDGLFGAHEKAIKDVEETVPAMAEKEALGDFEVAADDTFGRIYHDIKRDAADHALVESDSAEEDPTFCYRNSNPSELGRPLQRPADLE